MKKLLKPLFTALFAGMVCTGAKAAEPQVIDIRTDDLSMVMSVAPNGEVLFHHFGGRIDDASPAGRHQKLPPHGSRHRQPRLLDDGRPQLPRTRAARDPRRRGHEHRTALRVARHAHAGRQERQRDGRQDSPTTDQALDVELVYTAYARENVITTHTVIRNREKGDAVTLHSLLFVVADAVKARQLPADPPLRLMGARERRPTTRCSPTARRASSRRKRGAHDPHRESRPS